VGWLKAEVEKRNGYNVWYQLLHNSPQSQIIWSLPAGVVTAIPAYFIKGD